MFLSPGGSAVGGCLEFTSFPQCPPQSGRTRVTNMFIKYSAHYCVGILCLTVEMVMQIKKEREALG